MGDLCWQSNLVGKCSSLKRYEGDRPALIPSPFRYSPSLEIFSPSRPCNAVKRDHEAISSILRRYIRHASSMLRLPASMAAKTMIFLLATQRTVLVGGRVTSAHWRLLVETATSFSACFDTMLLLDLGRDDDPRVPLEAFTTVNSYHFGAEAREPFIRLEPVSVPLAHRHSSLPPPSMVAAGGGGRMRQTSRPRVLLSQKSCRKCLHNTMMGSKLGTLAKPLPHLCRNNRAPSC
jgi:hypothetical protein